MKTIIKKIDKISFIVIVDGVEYLPKDEDDIKTLSQYNYLNNVYMLHPSWYEDIMEGIEVNSSKIIIKDEYACVASITTFDSLLLPALNLDKIQSKWSAFTTDKKELHEKYLQEESLKAQLFCNSVLGMRPDIGYYIEVNGITISKDVFPKEYEQITKAWSKVHEKLNEFKSERDVE